MGNWLRCLRGVEGGLVPRGARGGTRPWGLLVFLSSLALAAPPFLLPFALSTTRGRRFWFIFFGRPYGCGIGGFTAREVTLTGLEGSLGVWN